MPTHIEPFGLQQEKPTRERILDQAERFIAQKGVFGFHLKEIATPLDIKVPAIYKHFKNRDDVLIEVSRRFIFLLSQQFQFNPRVSAKKSMERALKEFVDFNIEHPAYVRLALVDFATPQGGMEYVRIAAGGTFKENFAAGPLEAMHKRLEHALTAGKKEGVFREIDALEYYRVIYSNTLLNLVFPEDTLLTSIPVKNQVKRVKQNLIDVAFRFLS